MKSEMFKRSPAIRLVTSSMAYTYARTSHKFDQDGTMSLFKISAKH
jgi:hypothetical protein